MNRPTDTRSPSGAPSHLLGKWTDSARLFKEAGFALLVGHTAFKPYRRTYLAALALVWAFSALPLLYPELVSITSTLVGICFPSLIGPNIAENNSVGSYYFCILPALGGSLIVFRVLSLSARADLLADLIAVPGAERSIPLGLAAVTVLGLLGVWAGPIAGMLSTDLATGEGLCLFLGPQSLAAFLLAGALSAALIATARAPLLPPILWTAATGVAVFPLFMLLFWGTVAGFFYLVAVAWGAIRLSRWMPGAAPVTASGQQSEQAELAVLLRDSY